MDRKVNQSKKGRRLRLLEARDAFLLILPFFILISIFSIYPILQGINLCFYRVMLTGDKFIGPENFEKLFNDIYLVGVLKNTVYFGLVTMLAIALSMFPALLINSTVLQNKPNLRFVFQAGIVLPVVISWLTLGTAWNWMFLTSAGAVAQGGGALASNPLGNSSTVLPTMGLILVWGSLGYNTILFLAGIRSIPKVMYEASQVDGATTWQTFRYITLPAVRPMLTFMVVSGFIGAFQIFDPVAALTNGGPGIFASASIVFYMVRQALYYYNYGYAAVLGVIVMAIVFTLSVIQFRIIYKKYV